MPGKVSLLASLSVPQGRTNRYVGKLRFWLMLSARWCLGLPEGVCDCLQGLTQPGASEELCSLTILPFESGCVSAVTGGAMGSAEEVNIQAAELNRTMKVSQEPQRGFHSRARTK